MPIIQIRQSPSEPEIKTLTLAEAVDGETYLIVEGRFKGRVLFCNHKHQKVHAETVHGDSLPVFATDSTGVLWFDTDKDDTRYTDIRLRQVNIEMLYTFVD